MNDINFPQVLEEYRRRYPLMRPQDYGKLAYQNVFGSGHITLDTGQTLSFIQEEWDAYFPVMLRLAELTRNAGPVVAAIDGLCGSGKTRLSELIGHLFPCNIFHMDDFYLPPAQRAQKWAEIPGGNMDLNRFLETVLRPVRLGEPVQYQPYDCQNGTFHRKQSIPPQQLNIVEGSYSHHPILNGRYDLRIFLTCSRETQRSRLQKREGDYFPVFEQCWIPMENRYLERFSVRNTAEIVIDTNLFGS